MWLLILEALGAGALLVFIVWWTMFSGPGRAVNLCATTTFRTDRSPSPRRPHKPAGRCAMPRAARPTRGAVRAP